MTNNLRNQNSLKVSGKNNCANCGNNLEGNFCSSCGQKSGITRLNNKELFSIISTTVLLFERRYWRTARDFLKDPIKMIKNYSEGKRKYYAPPIQFFYFFSTLSIILNSLFPSKENLKEVEPVNIQESDAINSDALGSYLDQRISFIDSNFGHIMDNYQTLFDLSFPIIMGIVVFLFYRKIMNLAESFAFSFLLMAFVLGISSIISKPFGNSNFGIIISISLMVIPLFYVFYRLGNRKVVNVFLGILICFTSFCALIVISFVLIFLLYPILK